SRQRLVARQAGLRVHVVRGAGLRPMDHLIGASSDPFCEVWWNGTVVGRTPVRKRTLHPEWYEGSPAEGFPLDMLVPEGDQ
ncbi:unnamed protein product, partial [Discosporangium mesarthrocarpum]